MVPNLRFKKYSNDWVKYKITDLGKMQRGKSKHRPRDDEKLYGGEYPFIQTGDIKKAHLYINEYEKTYSTYGLSQSKLWKKGTLCITIAANIAETAILGMDACFPDSIIGWCSNNQLTNNLFIKYYFDFYKEQLKRLSVGGAQENLNLDKLEKIYFNIPSLQEQNKIADFFYKIDEKIVTQIKIIDDYVSLKNYLLKSFFQEFNEYDKLSTLIKFGKAGGTPKSTVKDYYDGDIPFLSISDITNQGKYIKHTIKHISQKGLNNSSAWLVPKNSLILSMYASVGLPTINRVPLATSQAMISMVLKNQHEVEFIYYYLCYFKKYKIRTFLETGTQSNINADIVKSIKIPKIKKDEKEKITDLLIKIDQLIDNEKQILDFHKKEKKYLLKNMFI